MPDLKCPLCPRVCKNKGSLASHRKACEVKNNPSQMKTRRRLSKTLDFGLRQPEDRDKRLSTTLLVKEVKYLMEKIHHINHIFLQHKCYKCGDVLATPTSLKMHMLTHD